MLLRDLPVLILDCQTTGHSPATGNVVEVSWQVVRSSQVGTAHSPPVRQSWVSLPEGLTLPAHIQKLTGITPQTLERAPNFQTVWSHLLEEVAGYEPDSPEFLVIHYARFETSFLQRWHHSLYPEHCLPWEVLCTHQLAKLCFPNLPTYGIRGLSGYFGSFLSDHYRATGHVVATARIWKGLVEALSERGVCETQALKNFLTTKKVAKNKKREFLVPASLRQDLPDSPGVYRMFSRDETILYVGKATSLKKRVASYFKHRGGLRLGEMMTQVATVRVEPTATVFEAALLETDEIKQHNPRYNTSLKAGDRRLVYFSPDLIACQPERSPAFPVGPFPSPLVFAPLECILAGAEGGEVTFFFPELKDAPLFQRALWMCFPKRRPTSVQELVHAGFYRLQRLSSLPLPNRNDSSNPAEVARETEEQTVWTEARVIAAIERKLIRAAKNLRATQWLWRLANSEVVFPLTDGTFRLLKWDQGILIGRDHLTGAQLNQLPTKDFALPHFVFSIQHYDRLRILWSELRRELNLSDAVQIRWGKHRLLSGVALRTSLA